MIGKGALALLSITSTLVTSALAAVTWNAQPLNPPAFPLAVKSPYLSAWLPQGSGAALNDRWPTFWTGATLGWCGLVRVDGVAYSWMGIPQTDVAYKKAVQKSSKFTATQTTFVLSAGPVDLTINFLSPVEPEDFDRHSLPFSYVAISAVSTDGAAHSVQAYSDISGEWVSGDSGLKATWSTTTNGNIYTHQIQLASQTRYKEINDRAQYGTAYYSAFTAGTTYQSGGDKSVRNTFLQSGKLPNTQDTNFRNINDNWPVVGFAHDLGSVKAATQPVVITVGHARDPAIQYIIAGGALQDRSAYFWSKYNTAASAITFFQNDYANALSIANKLDSRVQTDGAKISSDYAAIVSLSVRQAFAAVELTVSKKSDGTFDRNDVLVFMKEISSNGNMNTVDVIMPAFPIFLYTNPQFLKNLLLVLFKYQSTGQYPNKWSIHDIGAHYPQALGHNDGGDEAMPVEESGNMLIMTLAYTRATGDKSLIQTYSKLLDQWTSFLITDSLIPAEQLSTDDFAGHLANQTNLAVKGIVGIRAMAEIASLLGDTAKANNYTAIATNYVPRWQQFAMSNAGSHLTLAYNQHDSWGLTYNLWADKYLKFNLFPQSIYDMQTKWYAGKINTYGIPLDTRHSYTKSDWEIWTAGIVSDVNVRNALIGGVKKFISSGITDAPFSDWYETVSGTVAGFRARPVAGGHFALLI